MSNVNFTSHYANIFKTWQAKLLGPKPTNEQLAVPYGLGARPGKQALAIAMSLRECGITAAQMQIACGGPQRNKLKGYYDDAYLKRDMSVPRTPEGHTVYRSMVTPKGLKRIETTSKRDAALDAAGKVPVEAGTEKPAKAKGAAKAKKVAKAKPAAEAPQVTVTASPSTAPEADQPQA